MAQALALFEMNWKDAVTIGGVLFGLLAGAAILGGYFYYKFKGAADAAESDDFKAQKQAADGYLTLYNQAKEQVNILTADNLRLRQSLEETKADLEVALKQNSKLLARIDAQDVRIDTLEAALGIKGGHSDG